MKPKLAAGNWKMNGLSGDLIEIETLIADLGNADCDVLICPPATLIHRMHDRATGSDLRIGARDCHAELKRAPTGDLSGVIFALEIVDGALVGRASLKAADFARIVTAPSAAA